jgi:hypothetical protein
MHRGWPWSNARLISLPLDAYGPLNIDRLKNGLPELKKFE